MTNFERKKKNGALDVFGGHHTRKLAGIFGDIGSYPGECSLSAAVRPRRSARCQQPIEASPIVDSTCHLLGDLTAAALIPEQLRRRRLPPRRTQPELTRALAPG